MKASLYKKNIGGRWNIKGENNDKNVRIEKKTKNKVGRMIERQKGVKSGTREEKSIENIACSMVKLHRKKV